MKYSVKTISNKDTWEKFSLSQKPRSFLQSWNWGETNRLMGHKIFRLGFYEGNKIVGICLLIKERARRGPHLVIPGGPLMMTNNKQLFNFFVKTIQSLGKEEQIWFIRIRPEIEDSKNSKLMFKKSGFRPAPMHLHAENTWILDISKTEDELLAGMRKTTRYLIRKGMKSDLKLEISDNPKIATDLFKLQEVTAERHNFVGFSKRLFEYQLETFGKDNEARFFSCFLGKKRLACAIIIFYGDTAYYHHSGSVNGFNNIPFSYFLQWEIIKEAKNRGLKYYNFWGIAPDDNPNHRFAGVTMFKTGFGGERIDWLHAHDLPLSPLYSFTKLFEDIRRITRKL